MQAHLLTHAITHTHTHKSTNASPLFLIYIYWSGYWSICLFACELSIYKLTVFKKKRRSEKLIVTHVVGNKLIAFYVTIISLCSQKLPTELYAEPAESNSQVQFLRMSYYQF
jgi:hypothetical protein